jgi:hypothetical protein
MGLGLLVYGAVYYVTAYPMVELPNALPKQVVVGSNSIARSKPRLHPGTPQIYLGDGIDTSTVLLYFPNRVHVS